MNKLYCFFLFATVVLCYSCTTESKKSVTKKVSNKIQFELLSSESTGVTFTNKIDIYKVKTYLEYMNAYNGGGVAIGDVNNDGLADIYFTGNTSTNKLYLNKGNLTFEDITLSAGVAAKGKWCTGATMADVNNDGYLDIYVSVSYLDKPEQRENLLFINDGNLGFAEQAEAFGINDNRYTIDAAFIDYDKDNDLDLFVANHDVARIGFTFDDFYNFWKNPDGKHSDALYRNNGDGTYTDVSKEAGIFNYGFSLSTSISDFNNDGWQDIYVAVDHAEPDILYQNNGDGTFTNVVHEKFKHITFSSMGTDAADFNNDGLIDLYAVDMLSADNYRNKAQMGDMNPDFFWNNVDKGYHYAYMRNQLHMNVGDGKFAEIGQMANVDKTDWSWAALFADLNNNGTKDLFITNGYLLDIMDKDSRKNLDKTIQDAYKKRLDPKKVFLDFTLKLTSTKLANYCYLNNGDLTFTDVSKDSGLNFNGFSNGAAYADLDNDGDLDLIVNNINDMAFIYKNNADKNGNHYLRVKLNGQNKSQSHGARVSIITDGVTQLQEFNPVRGYQSSVDHVLHFGLGNIDVVETVKIQWPDGKVQTLTQVAGDQMLEVSYNDAVSNTEQTKTNNLVFKSSDSAIVFEHEENDFDDYEKQVLLPHKMSHFGPHTSVGDVNMDGKDDVFVGGASGQAGAIFIQNKNGKFDLKSNPVLEKDKQYEDYGSTLVDVDKDGDLDLYVVSGGNEFPNHSSNYQDRLYLNDGAGSYSKSTLPEITTSGSVVLSHDFDKDGDQDLFVGGRQVPGQYPRPVKSYMLKNENGAFSITDLTVLDDIGMVTDGLWYDMDADGKEELVLVGEWMPITVLKISDDQWINATADYGLADTQGWWNTIEKGDLDNDGIEELVLGNLGLNYKYRATADRPFQIHANDFDSNGNYDIVLSYINDEGHFPLRGRQCSSEQIGEISEEFENYDKFAKASLQDVYGDKLNTSLHYSIKDFNTGFIKKGNTGKYTFTALPTEAQMFPTYGIVVHDFDEDGNADLLLGGNQFHAEVETGRADAGNGILLKGDGSLNFQAIPSHTSGFYAPGDVRHLSRIDNKVIVANNDAAIQTFEF